MSFEAFSAPGWLRHAHLQTTFPALLRKPPLFARNRERFEFPDGDFVDLDWFDDDIYRPLVLVLHGLAGSTNSIYVLGIQLALRATGIGSVAMNFRGAGGTPNRLARTYHAGDTADLGAIVHALATRFPQRPLAVLGYSLGGNVVLKWLGECGAASLCVPVAAACAVSPPIDLAACSAQLDRGFSRIYRNRLRDELVSNLRIKELSLRVSGNTAEADKLLALGDLKTIRTFREYDDRVIASLHGFRDADDYYRLSSARQYLHDISVPTLVIHARDDPFMTPAVAPVRNDVSESVQLAVSAQGGHVGFVRGTPLQPRYWLEERVPDFFASVPVIASAIRPSGPGEPGAR